VSGLEMPLYLRAAVLLSVILTELFWSGGSVEVASVTEKDLELLIPVTDHVLVLYCKYCRPYTVLRIQYNRVAVVTVT